eukprot:scaffold23599_cov181-Cylindrotheca_fusiformis.AAC.3
MGASILSVIQFYKTYHGLHNHNGTLLSGSLYRFDDAVVAATRSQQAQQTFLVALLARWICRQPTGVYIGWLRIFASWGP